MTTTSTRHLKKTVHHHPFKKEFPRPLFLLVIDDPGRENDGDPLLLVPSLLLFQEGSSQLCYNSTDCTGARVAATDERNCCVGTDDGLSFHDGSTCSLCIGN